MAVDFSAAKLGYWRWLTTMEQRSGPPSLVVLPHPILAVLLLVLTVLLLPASGGAQAPITAIEISQDENRIDGEAPDTPAFGVDIQVAGPDVLGATVTPPGKAPIVLEPGEDDEGDPARVLPPPGTFASLDAMRAAFPESPPDYHFSIDIGELSPFEIDIPYEPTNESSFADITSPMHGQVDVSNQPLFEWNCGEDPCVGNRIIVEVESLSAEDEVCFESLPIDATSFGGCPPLAGGLEYELQIRVEECFFSFPSGPEETIFVTRCYSNRNAIRFTTPPPTPVPALSARWLASLVALVAGAGLLIARQRN